MEKIDHTDSSLQENILSTKQFQAILASLEILCHDFPWMTTVIQVYKKSLFERKFDNQSQLINNFIGWLDIFFINQMVDERIFSKLKQFHRTPLSTYGRDKNIENISYHWMSENHEAEFIIRNTKTSWDFAELPGNVIPWRNKKIKRFFISSIEDFLHIRLQVKSKKVRAIFFKNTLTIEEFEKLFSLIDDIEDQFFILWNVWLDDQMAMQFSFFSKGLTPFIRSKFARLFYIRKSWYDAMVLPDMQSVIRANISSGLTISGTFVPENGTNITKVLGDTPLQVYDALSWEWGNRRQKLLWNWNLRDRSAWDFDTFLRRHEEHYQKLITDSQLWKPNILFTKWGALSNNVVLNVLREMIPDQTQWVEHDFYHEHQSNFLTDGVDSKTRVFCFSPSILTPIRWWNAAFWSLLQLKLSRFMENVKRFPWEQFYVVIDITTRFGDGIHQYLWIISSEVPENLHIITTFSLSKHQRWNKGYFYWWIALYWDNGLHSRMEKMIQESSYALTIDSIVSFPRLRKGEIISQREWRKKNCEAFKEGWFSIISQTSLGILTPELIEGDMFLFIILPFPELLFITKYTKVPKNQITTKMKASHFLLQWNCIPKSILGQKMEYVPDFIGIFNSHFTWLNVEFRDGFGFVNNSIQSLHIPYHKVFSQFNKNDNYKVVNVPRISFWFKWDSKGSCELWALMAKCYIAYIRAYFQFLRDSSAK